MATPGFPKKMYIFLGTPVPRQNLQPLLTTIWKVWSVRYHLTTIRSCEFPSRVIETHYNCVHWHAQPHTHMRTYQVDGGAIGKKLEGREKDWEIAGGEGGGKEEWAKEDRKHSTRIGSEANLREDGIQKGIINPEKRCKASEFSDRSKYYTGQHIQSLDWTGLDLFLWKMAQMKTAVHAVYTGSEHHQSYIACMHWGIRRSTQLRQLIRGDKECPRTISCQ